MQSVFDGCWFTIVAMTTVGYGDIELTTTVGKSVAVTVGVAGVVLVALPISVIW
jgi:hypothetical protein